MLRDAKVEYHYSEPLGMDLSTNPLLLPDGAVVEAYNIDISDGTYERRGGISEIVDAADLIANTSITAGIEFQPSTGALQDIVFGTTGDSGGGTTYLYDGTFTSIETGLDADARPFFTQLGTQLLFVNGEDTPFLYTGSTTKAFGIAAPASLTAASSASSGGKIEGQRYLVAITYYNSVTGAESSPTFASPVVIASGHSSIALTFAAAASATANTIRIYCSYASSSTLLLEDEIGDSATSYSAVASDFELTQPVLELDNSRITDFSNEINFPALISNRLFLKTANNEIRNSKIGQSGPMFESFEASAVCSTESKYGITDDIVGIGSAGDVPIIVKERSVGRLDALGVPDTLSPVDPVRYTYVELSDNIGGVWHSTGVQVFGEYVFLGKSNIYATDGRTVRKVCDQLSPLIRRAGFTETQKQQLSAINDETNKRVLISMFETASSQYPDYVLVGDYDKYPDFRWTVYRPGLSRVTHPGIRVGCFYSKKTTLGAFDYFVGNIEENGQIYQLDAGNNDVTFPTYFKLKTKAYTFSDPAIQKLVKTCTLQAEDQGNGSSLQISSIINLSNTEQDYQTILLDASGDTWDNAVWDQSMWAGGQQLDVQYEPHIKCRNIQLVFRQIDLDSPLRLYSWDLTASTFRVF